MIKAEINKNEDGMYSVDLKQTQTNALEVLYLIDILIETIELHTELKYKKIIKLIKETRKEVKKSCECQNECIDNTNK